MAEEWDFSTRSLRWTEPVLVPEVLLRYRIHPHNTYREHQERRTNLTRQILARFATEACLPSQNPTAPVPTRWPRFFPLFCRSCNNSLGEAVGTSFPTDLTRPGQLRTPDAVPSELEQAATRRLLDRLIGNTVAGPSDPSTQQALTCAKHWAHFQTALRPHASAQPSTQWTWAGAAIIVTCGLYVWYRERMLSNPGYRRTG